MIYISCSLFPTVLTLFHINVSSICSYIHTFIHTFIHLILITVNEFIKSMDDICIPVIKPSITSGNFKLSLPLIIRQLKRVSKLLRNFGMFREIISPVVYERVIWNFMCGRVLPSIVCNLNICHISNEGQTMAISICETFIQVLPSVPLYGNQLSKSRHELLLSLQSIITSIKDTHKHYHHHGSLLSSSPSAAATTAAAVATATFEKALKTAIDDLKRELAKAASSNKEKKDKKDGKKPATKSDGSVKKKRSSSKRAYRSSSR